MTPCLKWTSRLWFFPLVIFYLFFFNLIFLNLIFSSSSSRAVWNALEGRIWPAGRLLRTPDIDYKYTFSTRIVLIRRAVRLNSTLFRHFLLFMFTPKEGLQLEIGSAYCNDWFYCNDWLYDPLQFCLTPMRSTSRWVKTNEASIFKPTRNIVRMVV